MPFALSGVNPQTPKKALLSIATLSSLLGQAEGWHTTHPLLYASHAQGHWGSHRMTSHRGWLVDNRPPRGGRERLANIHPRATKKSLLEYFALNRPPIGRSVAYRHCITRLLLQLCKLRHNSPPQDRLHRSKVATLARANAQYTAPPTIRTIHTVAISLVFPVNGLQSRLARLASLSNPPLQTVLGGRQTPKTRANETPARPFAPHYGKIRKTEFSNGNFV